jgi:hypothetical protein
MSRTATYFKTIFDAFDEPKIRLASRSGGSQGAVEPGREGRVDVGHLAGHGLL